MPKTLYFSFLPLPLCIPSLSSLSVFLHEPLNFLAIPPCMTWHDGQWPLPWEVFSISNWRAVLSGSSLHSLFQRCWDALRGVGFNSTHAINQLHALRRCLNPSGISVLCVNGWVWICWTVSWDENGGMLVSPWRKRICFATHYVLSLTSAWNIYLLMNKLEKQFSRCTCW